MNRQQAKEQDFHQHYAAESENVGKLSRVGMNGSPNNVRCETTSNDALTGGSKLGIGARSPLGEAEALLKADAEHRSLAADQALMLRMVMPYVGQGLNQLAEGCYKWFAHQGFWSNWMKPWGVGVQDSLLAAETKLKKAEKIALIHSEVSEMLEAVRKGDQDNEAEEAADILVRLLDYCGACGIDLGRAFERKMLANYQRPFRHNKAF